MKRRNFIFVSAVGIAAVGIPTYYYKFSDIVFDPALKEPVLLSTIWDTETIRSVGVSYRQRFEDNKRAIVNALYEGMDRDQQAIPDAINQKVMNDFANEQTVTVDGWILSVTEARQCALFTLTETK